AARRDAAVSVALPAVRGRAGAGRVGVHHARAGSVLVVRAGAAAVWALRAEYLGVVRHLAQSTAARRPPGGRAGRGPGVSGLRAAPRPARRSIPNLARALGAALLGVLPLAASAQKPDTTAKRDTLRQRRDSLARRDSMTIKFPTRVADSLRAHGDTIRRDSLGRDTLTGRLVKDSTGRRIIEWAP